MMGHFKTLCGCSGYRTVEYPAPEEMKVPMNLGHRPGPFPGGTTYSYRKFRLTSIDYKNALAVYEEVPQF